MADEKPLDPLSDQALFTGAKEDPPAQATSPEPEVTPPSPASTTPEPPAPSVEAGAEGDQAIPSWRLREANESRRAAEEALRQSEVRALQLENRLKEIDQFLNQRNAQQKPPDFFEDPQRATQALVQQVLAPHVQEVQRTLNYLGRMAAVNAHTAKVVDEAEQAFLEAHDAGTLDQMEYERVVRSPNRYDACVQWHKRQNVLRSVGEDPQAWFQRELEERLKSDQQFAAQVLEKVRGTAQAQPSVTRLPPSLSSVASAAPARPAAEGDLSDASLFKFARS